MNILWLLILALVCFRIAYRYYAGYILAKLGIQPDRKTPAVEKNDGSILYRPVWLHRSGRKCWFTLVPAVLMQFTTIASLVYYLFSRYIPSDNILLSITDIILPALAVEVIVQFFRKTKIFIKSK